MTDYKEKYEQAISRAKEVLLIAKEMISAMNDIGGAAKVDDVLHILHELSESEDERIKRCIGMCLTDATEQRFEDFNTTLKDCLAWLEKQGEQKPTEWSEEDIRNIQDIDSILFYDRRLTEETCMRLRNFLESLKDRVQPKQEWSEEDESHIGRILSYLESFKAYNAPHIEPIKKEIDWLKSIKPNLWKPSEEQKSVAERFARIVRGNLI